MNQVEIGGYVHSVERVNTTETKFVIIAEDVFNKTVSKIPCKVLGESASSSFYSIRKNDYVYFFGSLVYEYDAAKERVLAYVKVSFWENIISPQSTIPIDMPLEEFIQTYSLDNLSEPFLKKIERHNKRKAKTERLNKQRRVNSGK